MSSAYVLVAFAVCILLMILFISKWKIHPVTSILVATIILAISIGTPWDKIEGIINKGMADTLKSIAIVIVLGCILGKVLEETGAAVSITKATVKLFGEKRVLWAILLASAILGIPIWADTVVILLIPIVSNLALQTNKSMMSYGTALYMGALVTASLVPPTPGPVAAAALLHLPLSDAIMWGVLISIPSVFAAGLYCLTLKEPVAPQDEYIKSAEASKDKPLPSVGTSLAPIILPLVLIFLNTGINAMFPDTTVAKVFKFVGSPLAALLAGCLFSLVLTGAEWRSKKVMNDWVESALRSSAMPIMVTAMGGALAAFIKNAGVANAVAETVVQFSIPGIIIPILIAALIHVITGSNALGVMTAAALVEPMLGALGISPLAAFLACGTGALMFKHANSSGFWVTVTMSNMDIRQGIRAVGGGSTVAGVTGAAITVNKTDAQGKALAGATFVLEDSRGREAYQATSNASGIVRFTKVDSGTYTLLEKAAPEDYVISDKTYELTVSGSRVTMDGKTYSPVTFVNRRAAELNRRDHYAFLVGYADGTFGPERNMTRAEVTTMFARLLTEQIEADKTYSSTFNDVAKDCWAANYIGYMQQFGIVTGYEDGSFRPDAPVTRAEFAAIASRFEKLTQGSASFTDVPDTHWAVKYINFAATRGWVTGYEDGTFKPEHSITRAEVAAVTCRLLERSADQTYIRSHIGELRTFADVTESHWAYWYAMEAANGHDYTKSGGSENWSRTHR